jgi:Bifunctional DNA primase/polymerase, N-terminal
VSTVDFVLHTAQQGYSVFPLAPNDKVPAIPKGQGGRGYLDATRDPQQIERWWDRYPEANIGIETGGTLLVMDIDPRKSEQWLESLRNRDQEPTRGNRLA